MNHLRLLHMTDSHILKDYTAEPLLNFEHNESPTDLFIKALGYAEARKDELDGIIISGDLVHEGDSADYQLLKELIDQHTSLPVFTVLGNHDMTEAYWEGFENKLGCSDRLYYKTLINGYRLIVLDSSHDKSGIGMLGEEQLSYLKEVLAQPSQNGTIIALHHPPVSGEVTAHDLQDSVSFLNIIEGTDVVGVLSGHIHRSKNSRFGSTLLSTAGSTAFGFEMTAEEFKMTDEVGFSLCAINGQEMTAQAVRFPHHVNVLKTFNMAELIAAANSEEKEKTVQ